jgi:hypothetical protein
MTCSIYEGTRTPEGVSVTCRDEQGQERPLPPRLDLWNHSPTGFEYGYGGSGPAQLSLALLADALGDDAKAVQLHQAFKWEVTARLPARQNWTLSDEEVRSIAARLEARQEERQERSGED